MTTQSKVIAFPPSRRSNALELTRRGFKVFRLRADTKNGFIDRDWTESATACRVEVFERWSSHPTANIGVLTTGLCVIDVDVKGVSGGLESLTTLGPLPDTYTQRTPSGGLHIVFRTTGYDVHNSVGKLGSGLDVRGHRGFILGAGSTMGGNPYTVENDAPIAELPEHLRVMIEALKVAPATVSTGEIDSPINIEVARYVLETEEPAILGSGGDNRTIAVANHVMDMGLSVAATFEVMQEWNERCEPSWTPDDLQRKIESAAKSRQNAIGCHNPSAGFTPVPANVVQLFGGPPEGRKLLKSPSEISVDELRLAQSKAIIRDLIPSASCGFVYGDPGSGKTFGVVDMCFHLACKKDWHGNRVKRRIGVLYCCLEGVVGFEHRQLAAMREIGDPGKYFQRYLLPVSLVAGNTGQNGVEAVVKAARQFEEGCGQPPELVIFDTLSRAIPGDDENSADAMSAFIEKRLNEITRRTGASCLVIHHTSKAGTMRGSSVQNGAADFIIKATKNDDGSYSLDAEKVKDGESRRLLNYRLRPVELYSDDEGKPVYSCVVDALPKQGVNPAIVAEVNKRMGEAHNNGERISLTDRSNERPWIKWPKEPGSPLEFAKADEIKKLVMAHTTAGNWKLDTESKTKANNPQQWLVPINQPSDASD